MTALPRLLLSLALALGGQAALAHTGNCHFHGKTVASATTVTACADERKASLLQAGKLEASWEAVAAPSVTLGAGPKGEEWRVVYDNPRASDPTKRRLFLFFTPQGNFVAANHSGQ
ncbi:DUF6488 family protein [Hydrogenophaga sp.]|uniref:DUF6488 family protein n=1 Tax=Hydrogenophaga sp. TaxID=1904254 RepID=UPI00391B7DEF